MQIIRLAMPPDGGGHICVADREIVCPHPVELSTLGPNTGEIGLGEVDVLKSSLDQVCVRQIRLDEIQRLFLRAAANGKTGQIGAMQINVKGVGSGKCFSMAKSQYRKAISVACGW